ncbi:hypothetical protein Aab01nite_31770 [Paractinoplanes abujensis]|uniref:DNA-binding helix-hairpin-helix protein with protein kinase domain n=1 Tax=Paractinoplanes abujensis TaxID=882441 RepID=A0A7W7G8H1_9ACTN|nr:protein kinase [Actinoplanes abujensis]MBB4697931.1 DNA-binding helix-hairpin-helix protein with protein kinase domain [Actinoplanes abujensis]GID19587.1 hypothetical protein Aab01nite_31770 [Actinoplanes abujensis]
MRNFYLPSGTPIQLGALLGEGRQGFVFAVEGTDLFCAKIYLEHSEELARRLNSLVQAPQRNWAGDGPDHLHLAWPQSTLQDEKGVVRGVLMPYIPGVVLADLLSGQRGDVLDEPGWRTSIAVAGRLARVISLAHESGLVLGDLSPRNIMIDRRGRVTLIDCDTVQFTDTVTGRRLPAEHFTPEYLPPEAFPKPAVPLSTRHDRFGLGILICQVLMDGDHPYVGIPAGSAESNGVEDNIRHGRNRITAPGSLVPRPGTLPAELLPEDVRKLAFRCFAEGATDAAQRPTAAEWASALGRAGFELMGCRQDATHAYPAALAACPWCARAEALRVTQNAAPPGQSVPPPRPGSQPAQPNQPAQPAQPAPPQPSWAQPQSVTPARGTNGKTVAAVLAVVLLLLLVVAIASG